MSNLPEDSQQRANELLADYLGSLTSKMIPLARKGFEAEARAHLLEHAKAFEVRGDDPVDAMKRAIKQFGDPKALGRALHTPSWKTVPLVVAAFFDPYAALPAVSRRPMWWFLGCWAILAAAALLSRAAPHSFGELFLPDDRAFHKFCGFSVMPALLAGMSAHAGVPRVKRSLPIDTPLLGTVAIFMIFTCVTTVLWFVPIGSYEVIWGLYWLAYGPFICAVATRSASRASFAALRFAAEHKSTSDPTQPNKPWIL